MCNTPTATAPDSKRYTMTSDSQIKNILAILIATMIVDCLTCFSNRKKVLIHILYTIIMVQFLVIKITHCLT